MPVGLGEASLYPFTTFRGSSMPPLAPEGYCGLLDAKCHALHPQTLLSPYMEASNAGVSRPVTHGGLHKHLSLTLSLPPPPHTRTHTLNSTDSKGDVQAGHAYLATTSTSEDAPCPVRRPPVRNPFMRQRERESERARERERGRGRESLTVFTPRTQPVRRSQW